MRVLWEGGGWGWGWREGNTLMFDVCRMTSVRVERPHTPPPPKAPTT